MPTAAFSFRPNTARLGVLLAAAAAMAAAGRAAEPATSDETATLRELVAGLGSPSRRDREASEAAVLERGPAILGELSRLAPLAFGEARLRLERATAALEQRLIERDLQPATLTLSVERTPVRDLLARIDEETGNFLELSREVASGEAGLRPVSLEADRETYWEVVAEALGQAGLAVECGESGRALRVVDPGSQRAKPVPAGPFLVIRGGIEVGRDGASGRPIRVGLMLAWESRLEPLVITAPMRSVEVEGPSGESIPPASRRAVLEATLLPRSRWVPLVLPLAAGGPLPDRIASLRATVRTSFAAGEHDFELPLDGTASATPGVRVGSATVSLRGFERRGGRVVVSVEAEYDEPAEPLASHRTWITERPLALVATKGREGSALTIPPEEVAVTRRSERGLSVEAAFLPPDGSSPVRLRWRLPAAIRELPIDVLLRDVPLPGPGPPGT